MIDNLWGFFCNYTLNFLIWSFYTDHKAWDLERSYEKHMELIGKGSQCQGCIRPPAMPFDAEQYPPDMLHLKEGIILKLVNQVVDWTMIQHREKDLVAEMKRNRIPFV